MAQRQLKEEQIREYFRQNKGRLSLSAIAKEIGCNRCKFIAWINGADNSNAKPVIFHRRYHDAARQVINKLKDKV